MNLYINHIRFHRFKFVCVVQWDFQETGTSSNENPWRSPFIFDQIVTSEYYLKFHELFTVTLIMQGHLYHIQVLFLDAEYSRFL